MVTATDDTITIDNIGPITHLEIPAAPGTITVLRGANGCGKSTALASVSALARGGAKLTSRDGTTGGQASGFGVTIRVGRGGANRRMGDLTIEAVEDKLSIADFVEPNVKDPIAADGRRLKALISLAGVSADPTIYHEICGGPDAFSEIIKPETAEATDPIVMAERVKRDLESASRLHNQRAERLFAEASAKLATTKDLDLTAESNAETLRQNLEVALNNQSALHERARSAEAITIKRQQAQAALDKARADSTVPSLAHAEHAMAEIVSRYEAAEVTERECESKVAFLREQLRAAESARDLAVNERRNLDAQRSAAVSQVESVICHEATLSTWRKTLEETPAIEYPTETEIVTAAKQVEAARSADHQGVLIREAQKRIAEAAEIDTRRKVAVEHAERLRDAAKSVLDVLAEQVKTLVPGIKLDPDLRIVVPHPIRTECFYSDLSHGERWKLALDIAVASFRRLGCAGVLAIPQEAWEGLDGRNRKLLAELVAATDLIVFTAEAERSTEATGMEVEVVNGSH